MPKILLIEEDAVVSRILQIGLAKNLGAEVFTALGAEEGFRKLKDEEINLLVLDMFLQNQTTLDLIKKIKNDPETSAIPIVVITMIGDKENTDAARSLGVDSFIIKGGTSMRETVLTIKEALQKSSGA